MSSYVDHGGIFVPAAGGYDGAVDTRQRKRQAHKRSRALDEDRLVGARDRNNLRLECMDLRRNNAIVAGVCERFADNIVGPAGIIPQAKTSDSDWNSRAEDFWREWSNVVDYRHRVNMREYQRLLVQLRLTAGESFNVLVSNGQLQPVEAERVCTPASKSRDGEIVDGVKVNRSGIPVAYYASPRTRHGTVDRNKTQIVRSENMVHPYRPMRFDQVRGIPDLAPVLNCVTDFSRLQEETLNKAVLDALHAWVIKSQGGAQKLANLGPRVSGDTPASALQKYETFAGGQNYYLGTNESIESLASNTPNPQYVEYSHLILRMIGAALSIPYEFLVLDFKGGSFSASRAALVQTYRTFEMWHSWLRDAFLQRVWNWRIAKAIRAGELPPAPQNDRGVSQWYKVQWSPPEYSWIDPKKEVDAQTDEWNLGTGSISSFARKKGRDGEDVLREKADDIATAHTVAQELNQLHGMSLTWRDLINATRPGQATTKPEVNSSQPLPPESP